MTLPYYILVTVAIVFFALESTGEAEKKVLADHLDRQTFEPAKIIDFELYKRLFGKHYEPLEETVRRKYLLARAHRAWITALKYKFRQLTFYLAINHLSDQSPVELRRMSNHQPGNANNSLILDRLEPDEQIQRVLVSGHAEKQLIKVRRKKNADHGPRKSNFNKLISGAGHRQLDLETASKIELKPASNNPYYRAPEFESMGVRMDDIEEIEWFEYKRDENEENSSHLPDHADSQADDGHPNEVFVDHRDSQCMFQALDQGFCGSCYAFVGMAIAEWLYCKQTGQLVPFSVQYMIDCGGPHLNDGCDGGDGYSVAKFIHNCGLELAVNYPYRGRCNKCPYNDDTNRKSMGYIRMDLGSGVWVTLDRFEEVIPYGPMFMTIHIGEDFTQYGGGILNEPNCNPEPPPTDYWWHAVTLIGHGREDGREYWLIRNSHGVDWGEEGHAKMAKGSGCIFDRVGILYGTKNGTDLEVEPQEDPQYVAFKRKRTNKNRL